MEHLSKLKGKTVLDIVKDPSDGDDFYGLHFTDDTVAWVMRDPEGNGPGHLDIQHPGGK